MTKKDEAFMGYQTKEKCPLCLKGLLFTNEVGNKWCSNTDCHYHVDQNGKPKRAVEPLFGKFR